MSPFIRCVSAAVLALGVLCASCRPESVKPPAVPEPVDVKPVPVPPKPKPPVPVPPKPKPPVPVPPKPEVKLTPPGAPDQYFFPHGQLSHLKFHGKYLVAVASWTRGEGVMFFDLSDPANPVYLRGLISAGYVTDLVVNGEFAYISTGYSIMTVRLPNEKDPEPKLIENILISFPNSGVSRLGVDRKGLYAASSDGLRIYDISDPETPILKRIIPELKGLGDFLVAGEKITFFRAQDRKTLQTLNLSDGKYTDSPLEKNASLLFRDENNTILPAPAPALYPRRTGPNGLAYFTERVHPGEKVKRRYLEMPWKAPVEADIFYSRIFDTDGKRVASLADPGIQLGELPEGDGPIRKIASIPVADSEGPVLLHKGFVYSLSARHGGYLLYGFDLAKKQQPRKVGVRQPVCDALLFYPKKKNGTFYYDIVIPPAVFLPVGNWVFAPEALLDLSDPRHPKVAAEIDGAASCIVMDGKKRVFLAQGKKLTVYDGSKLPGLVKLAELPADADVKLWTEIAVDGGTLYAWCRDKLVVYDIANLAAPKKIASLDIPGCGYKMLRIGHYLYLPPYSGDKVFHIVDVADPAQPKLARSIPGLVHAPVLGMLWKNRRLYLANDREVRAYSLGDPLTPRLEGVWSGPDEAMQSYNYIDLENGILAGKKYPRIDVWRIEK